MHVQGCRWSCSQNPRQFKGFFIFVEHSTGPVHKSRQHTKRDNEHARADRSVARVIYGGAGTHVSTTVEHARLCCYVNATRIQSSASPNIEVVTSGVKFEWCVWADTADAEFRGVANVPLLSHPQQVRCRLRIKLALGRTFELRSQAAERDASKMRRRPTMTTTR